MKKLLVLLLTVGLGFNALAVGKTAAKSSHHKLTQAEKVNRAEERLEYKKAVAKALKNDKADMKFVEKAEKSVKHAEKHLADLKAGKKTMKRHHGMKHHGLKTHKEAAAA